MASNCKCNCTNNGNQESTGPTLAYPYNPEDDFCLEDLLSFPASHYYTHQDPLNLQAMDTNQAAPGEPGELQTPPHPHSNNVDQMELVQQDQHQEVVQRQQQLVQQDQHQEVVQQQQQLVQQDQHQEVVQQQQQQLGEMIIENIRANNNLYLLIEQQQEGHGGWALQVQDVEELGELPGTAISTIARSAILCNRENQVSLIKAAIQFKPPTAMVTVIAALKLEIRTNRPTTPRLICHMALICNTNNLLHYAEILDTDNSPSPIPTVLQQTITHGQNGGFVDLSSTEQRVRYNVMTKEVSATTHLGKKGNNLLYGANLNSLLCKRLEQLIGEPLPLRFHTTPLTLATTRHLLLLANIKDTTYNFNLSFYPMVGCPIVLTGKGHAIIIKSTAHLTETQSVLHPRREF